MDGYLLSEVADLLDGLELARCAQVDRALCRVSNDVRRWTRRLAAHDGVAQRRLAHRELERCARPPETAINAGLAVVRVVVHGATGCGASSLVDYFVSGEHNPRARAGRDVELRKRAVYLQPRAASLLRAASQKRAALLFGLPTFVGARLSVHASPDAADAADEAARDADATTHDASALPTWWCGAFRYAALHEAALEAAFAAGIRPPPLVVRGEIYDIDLDAMTEMCRRDVFTRPIERRTGGGSRSRITGVAGVHVAVGEGASPSSPQSGVSSPQTPTSVCAEAASSSSSSPPRASAQWYCGCWRYSRAYELLLEEARTAALALVDTDANEAAAATTPPRWVVALRIDEQTYDIDVRSMTQTNRASGYRRDIERTPRSGAGRCSSQRERGDGDEPAPLRPPPLSPPREGAPVVRVELFDKRATAVSTPFSAALYRGRLAMVFVFSVVDRASFTALDELLARACALAGQSAGAPAVLVGTHVDAAHRTVPRTEAEAFATQRGLQYVEASALTGEGVATAFMLPLAQLLVTAVSSALAEREAEVRKELQAKLRR